MGEYTPDTPDTSISRERVYGREDFVQRTGLGNGGFRSARSNGLRAYYLHSRCYILGSDWQDYVTKQSTVPPGPPKGTAPECTRPLPFPEDD